MENPELVIAPKEGKSCCSSKRQKYTHKKNILLLRESSFVLFLLLINRFESKLTFECEIYMEEVGSKSTLPTLISAYTCWPTMNIFKAPTQI